MSEKNNEAKTSRSQSEYENPTPNAQFYGPLTGAPYCPPFASAAGKFDPEQTYRFDPAYGFVPAGGQNSQNGNEQEKTQNYAPYGFYGSPFGYAQNYAPYAYRHAAAPFMHGPFPYCPPFISQAGYAQNYYANTASSDEEKTDHGLSQEKIQEIYSAVNDAINGNPDPGKLLGILQSTKSEFWKGLALGAGAVLLFNCTPLKTMLAGLFASQFSAAAAETKESSDAEGTDGQACMHEADEQSIQ